MIEIKSSTGTVLHRSEKDTLKDALEEANLSGADLSGANLSGANLSGAEHFDDAFIGIGETFGHYLTNVVPALCTAGGKTLEEVAAGWNCHSWDNCPMAIAFSVHDIDDIPALYRQRVAQFIDFFDKKMIPCPINLDGAAACAAPVEPPA